MNKPLSPHLSIYKFKLSLLMSIAHRITGGALYFSMIIFMFFFSFTSTWGTILCNLFNCNWVMDWEVNYVRDNMGHIPSHAWGTSTFHLGHW